MLRRRDIFLLYGVMGISGKADRMNIKRLRRARRKKAKTRKFSGIKRRWVINSLSIVIVALVIGIVAFTLGMMNYYYSSVTDNLTSRTKQTSRFINGYMNSSYEIFYSYIDRLTTDFTDKDKLELQVVNTYGRITMSSSGLTAGFIPGTPDVEQTLTNGDLAVYRGYDMLTAERVISVSMPLYYSNGQMIGLVRYVTSLKKIDNQILNMSLLAIAVAFFILLLILISNSYFIRTIINPILEINETAKEIAKGKYEVKLKKRFDDEIGELCDSTLR